MTVHSMQYDPAPDEQEGPVMVYCDLIGEDIVMFTISEIEDGADRIQSLETPTLTFKCNREVGGSIRFTFRTLDPVEALVLRGQIIICLEFTKVKAEKPQKVY